MTTENGSEMVDKPPEFSKIFDFVGFVNRNKASYRVPSNIMFLNDQGKTKLVFLAPENGESKNRGLFFIDIPTTSEFIKNPNWSTLCDFMFTKQLKPLSLAEELLYERQRASLCSGISDFDILKPSNDILAHLQGGYVIVRNHEEKRVQIPLLLPSDHVPIHICACPLNNQYFAYVHNHNIYVVNSSTAFVHPLTDVTNEADCAPNIIAGEASFVTQEEFDRYTGFWWQPKSDDDKLRILYETVKQENVDTVILPHFSGKGMNIEEHKYPRVGKDNAKSDLSIVEFDECILSNDNLGVSNTLTLPLTHMFPNYEYLVRAGWLPNGKYVWFTLINRDQTKLEVFVAPLSCFKTQESWELDSPDSSERPISVLTLEAPDTWVAVLPLSFLEVKDENVIEFVYLSEENDNSHIFHQKVSFRKGDGFGLSDVQKRQLTNGDFNVSKFWVDEEKELIYYLSYKVSPLCPQLYVTSKTFCGWHKQISDRDDFHHKVRCIDFSNDLVCLEYSNYSYFPGLDICQIEVMNHGSDQPPTIQIVKRVCLFEPISHYDVMNHKSVRIMKYSPPPEVITYTTKDGVKLYGLLFTPERTDKATKFPCIQYVYGGPEVMIVDGYYSYGSIFRFMKWCHFGYAVLVCDNRGSANRGHSFAAKNKFSLGRVEMDDQVEFLYHVASTRNCIDLSRVGITGWSYGGYMTLMAMAQFNNVYKMGIAGGSVTSWYLYDTGYTERYMGLRNSHDISYKTSDIEAYATGFPMEANRLFLVHGGADENVHFYHVTELIQLLIKYGKPYNLLLYPSDRHRIVTGALHLDASMILYFEQYLKR